MNSPAREKPAVRQKILIVDDKKENLFALEKILKHADADVVQALDGQTALAQALEHDFAVIILDVRMPGMDGYEVAEHLQGDSSTKNIPIIFVTAEYPEEKHMFRGYEAGAIDYMLKPYSPKILLSKVNILLEMDRNRSELQRHRDELEELIAERTTELSAANEELLQFSWLLEKKQGIKTDSVDPAYDDVMQLNRDGLILNAVGADTLKQISNDIMDLLDTSMAVYEKNGDYAFGIFVSNWCGTLDNASRALCETDDNRKALDCGKWLCHESCWKISNAAMDSGKPVDEACCGGIRMYAVPILSGDQIIGAVNFGYGTPPQTAAEQKAIAEAYQLDLKTIQHNAENYKPRPPFIINVAKRRLQSIAHLIGEIVERKQISEQLAESEARYDQLACQNRIIVWEVDTNGLYTYCSHVVENVLGYRPDEIVSKKHFYDLHPEEGRDAFKKTAFEVFSRKEVFQGLENPVETKEGRIVWMLTAGIPLLDEQGKLLGYRGSDTDITDRKRADDTLKEKIRELERFNKASVGRELRMIELKKEIEALQRRLADNSAERTAT